MRLGTNSHGFWIPRDWEHEAKALLYALRKEHSPFAKMPSFDSSKHNPFHGVELHELRLLSKAVVPKAPWQERSVDVMVKVGGTLLNNDIIPIIFLRMSEPMVHVAATAFLSSMTKWSFKVAPNADLFTAEFCSSKGEHLWGFSTPGMRDDDSLLLRKLIAVKNQAMLSIPLDISLYNELQDDAKMLPHSTLANCQNFFFSSSRRAHSVPRIESNRAKLVNRDELYALAA